MALQSIKFRHKPCHLRSTRAAQWPPIAALVAAERERAPGRPPAAGRARAGTLCCRTWPFAVKSLSCRPLVSIWDRATIIATMRLERTGPRFGNLGGKCQFIMGGRSGKLRTAWVGRAAGSRRPSRPSLHGAKSNRLVPQGAGTRHDRPFLTLVTPSLSET